MLSVFLMVTLIGGAALSGGCSQTAGGSPASLDSPTDMAVATGEVCLNATKTSQGVWRSSPGDCDTSPSPGIGLIASAETDRVAIATMKPSVPKIVDLDPLVPGVNHLTVGNGPVDVAASNDGSVGYALNQYDQTISVIDLWGLRTTQNDIELPGPGKLLRVHPDNGKLLVGLTEPSRLWIRPGVTCSKPQNGSEGQCTGLESSETPVTVQLPGALSDLSVTPGGKQAYVAYNDKPYSSVVALEELAEGQSCRSGGETAPCEISRVGLTFGCSDGIDNDGDGAVDQKDPQCYGPRGSESPGGIGRMPRGACADGKDNDGDGVVDRTDPDCQWSSDGSESTHELDLQGKPVCGDDSDNDEDGKTDYPDDQACYGVPGRAEIRSPSFGIESISVGPMGKFVYAVERSGNQVMVVSVEQQKLIDAQAVKSEVHRAFSDQVGVGVSSSPISVEGDLTRQVVWRESGKAVIKYEYGAWISSDAERVEQLVALQTYCKVDEKGELLDRNEIHFDSDALADSVEKNCLAVPEFPIPPDEESSACQTVSECEQCRDQSGDSNCPVCSGIDVARQWCDLSGRQIKSDRFNLLYNPRFQVSDARPAPAVIASDGECRAPEEFDNRLLQYLRDNPDVESDLTCRSPLRPQPVHPATTRESFDRENLQRAKLRERTQLQWALDSEDDIRRVAGAEIDDQAARNESWTVTFEGALPGAQGNEALVDADKKGRMVTGSELCSAGVRQGDRVTVVSTPGPPGRTPSEDCRTFVDRDRGPRYRTWTVESVTPHAVELGVIEGDSDNDYVDQLPSRECFPKGLKYEIRVEDEWTVVGERTGYVSKRKANRGRCVPVFRADNSRRNSRVETGQIYKGPYLSFRLMEGEVSPVQGMQYTFPVRSNYRPGGLSSRTIFPGQLNIFRGLNRGDMLAVPGFNRNFVFVGYLTPSVRTGFIE